MFSTTKGIVYLAFVFFLLNAVSSIAQVSQDQFGKNRIQYKKFKWKYISTENFEIYYYFEGEALAPIVATHAEATRRKLERSLGYSSLNKTKIVIYNSISDQQQSNIGLQQGTFIGGSTNLVKENVEVAFNGDLAKFREDITFNIARVWIDVILYGGSFKEVVQSSYFLSLPDWYINGAARYVASGWSREMDNFMRDLAVNNKIRNPSTYSSREAEWIGQSIWHYISQKYGADMFTNIIQITRMYRSDRASIEAVTGIYFQNFVDNWKEYYREKTIQLDGAELWGETFDPINGKNVKGSDLSTVVLSKDSRYLAYTSNYKGKYNVFVKDLQTGKKTKVYSGGFILNDQIPLLRNPLLAWQSETTLAFLINKKGKIVYRTFDLKTRKRQQRVIDVFHQINSFSFNEDGTYIAFSADEKGQSDIWLYDISRSKYFKVTNDEYDDHSPKFGPGNTVIFSSNRSDDTLTVTRYESALNYSLYIYKPGSKVLKRIPAQSCNYTQPSFYDANTIVFLSDNNGILNLYKQDLISGTTSALTNSITDISEYDVHTSKPYLSIISRSGGKEHVYLDTLFSVQKIITSLVNTAQSLSTKKKMVSATDKPKAPSNLVIITKKKPEENIDLDKVYFESDTTLKVPTKAKVTNTLKQQQTMRRSVVAFNGPHDYKNLFSTDKVSTALQVDPLRGFGMLLESGMSDMMANHRVNLGMFGLVDLKSSSFFGEYSYLKKRVDFTVRFDRNTYFDNSGSTSQRYATNRVAVTASYPLSVYSRISATPFVLTNRYSDLTDYTYIINTQDVVRTYAGTKFEFVYDNTTTSGMNMIEGTRGKILLDINKNLETSTQNFNRINVDLRHYQKIHKGLTLALRGSFGRFFGAAPKSFLFGGMDNWLFNSTGTGGVTNPLALTPGVNNSDIMMDKFVTNVRGFQYNTQSGSSYFLFNAELRFPIFKYLYGGTVSSALLRNFQLVGFSDIGASWYGPNPFNSKNTLNTNVINNQGPAFTATVINFRNPLLYGYGLGIRTFLLGYYVKYDLAWGIKDGQSLSPVSYITLGYDF